MEIAVSLHVIAVVLWVGGMFFAHTMLRPVAASQLEPPLRLNLWVGVFRRFFPLVWVAVAIILASGYWIIFAIFGGMGQIGLYVHAMLGIGTLMMLIFAFVFFVPYRHLQAAVVAQDWPRGAAQLARIRHLVGVNTVLGLITIAIASGGRYLVV